VDGDELDAKHAAMLSPTATAASKPEALASTKVADSSSVAAEAVQLASSSGSTTPPSSQPAPNDYNVLQSPTIASIYAATAKQLPSVAADRAEDEAGDVSDEPEEDDSDDDDVDDDGSSESDGGELQERKDASDAGGSKGKGQGVSVARRRNKAHRPKSAMPKILGFGPDDAHLIQRPLFGAGGARSAGSTGSAASAAINDGLGEDDAAMEAWTAMPAASAAGSGSAHTAKQPVHTSLADMLDARRAARLGSAAGSSKKSSTSRVSRGAGTSTTPAATDADGPSSTATDVTAADLLASFIHAQQAPPPAVSEQPASAAVDDVGSGRSEPRERAFERQQKNALFLAASEVLERKSNEDDGDESDELDAGLRSGEEDDTSDSADESSVPIDPRAAAIEARRQARVQKGTR
jgi:hypothetical protein